MIPIDVISGFLGAGKTTFTSRLLEYYIEKGERPVYIVNEFGNTGLDAKLLENEGFEAVEMANGCICCTLKDSVVDTIRDVIRDFSPTRIVFEPSGIFIFDNFLELVRSKTLQYRCRMGSVITVVDSLNFNDSKLKYGNFLYNQIKSASALVVSKLEKSRLNPEEIVCDIHNINPGAFVFAKEWRDMTRSDLRAIVSHAAYDRKNNQRSAKPLLHESFQTLTLPVEKELTQIQVEGLVCQTQNGSLGELSRVKGIMKVDGRFKLLNIAQQDVELRDYPGITEPAITFIGRILNRKRIQSVLT